MEDTLVFVDEGFLDKLTKFFGEGIRLKFDKLGFARRIAKKQNLFCKHLFYYTCSPFQSTSPTDEEIKRRRGYDKFVSSIKKNKEVTVREGRLQKIINEAGEIEFKQKGVDTLLTIDLGHTREDYPSIKRVILVSSDTDFCPIIQDIKKRAGIEVILYSYFDRTRKSKFSLSNELLKCCFKYVKLTKEDFTSCPISNKDDEGKRKSESNERGKEKDNEERGEGDGE